MREEEPHKPRGRPRVLGPTIMVSARIPDWIYSVIATRAIREGKDVSDALREELEEHLATKGIYPPGAPATRDAS